MVHRLNPGLARFDARLEHFERRVVVGRSPLGAAAYGARALWVASPEEDSVNRIDDDTGDKVVIGVGRRLTGVAARGSQVWVTSLIDQTISRIDPRASKLAGKPLKVPLNPYALTLTGDSIWLTALGRGEVARVLYRAPR